MDIWNGVVERVIAFWRNRNLSHRSKFSFYNNSLLFFIAIVSDVRSWYGVVASVITF